MCVTGKGCMLLRRGVCYREGVYVTGKGCMLQGRGVCY